MSNNEHSESEFYYLDEFEFQDNQLSWVFIAI